MEQENKYGSKAVGGNALGLSIGAVAAELLGGNLGNILGGWGVNNCNGYAMCSDNMPINRYEASQSARIAELETEVKLRDANTYTDSKLNDFRNYVDRKFDRVEHELCEQKVFNATTISNVGCISQQVAQLMSLTKLVVPNGSICPGWGDVTVSITPATATTTTP